MNFFRQCIHFQKHGAENFGKAEIELNVGQMGTKPEQEPDNPS
jgi:hypothetical protein